MRIGKNAVIQRVLHFKGFRQGSDALLALLTVNLIDIAHEIQIFQALQTQEDIGIIRYDSKFLFCFQRLLYDVFSIDQDFSLIRIKHTCDHFDRCGLAGTVGTDKADDFSRGDG